MSKKHRHGPIAPPMPSGDRSGAGAPPAPGKDRADAAREASEPTVHLKPILGFRPGAYLAGLYAIVLALLVFFLLFYPGLHRRGQFVAVSSVPGRATVSVDGVFAGTTPCTVFVKKGEHTIEAARPWFKAASSPLQVRGRFFATLIVPDKVRKTFELPVADAQGLTKWALADFQKNPSIPTIISEVAWAAYKEPQNRAILYAFLYNCMYSVQAELQLRELLLAGGRIASDGQALTPLSLVTLVQKSVQLKQNYDNSPAWLLLSMSRDNGRKAIAKPWAVGYLTTYRDALLKYYQGSLAAQGGVGGARGSAVQGVVFRNVPAGTLIMGNDEKPENLGRTIDQALPHPISVSGFSLAETEVTNRQFHAFLGENADWRPSNRESLTQKGLVTDQYLSAWTDNRPPAGAEDLPVTSVSFHAATAFCTWLTAKAAFAAPGFVVRLPTEAEWEWAARGGLRGMPYPLGEKPGTAVLFSKGITGPSRAGTSEPNAWGLRDMVGNVWEWCADSYSPAAYLLSSLDPKKNAELAARLPGSVDRVVRGGSWNNARDQVKVHTRGSQPANWCTPYLGFRVALGRP